MVTKTVLRNGLRVILAPHRGSVATTVLILVEAGSEYETKKINGISHFLEHLVFKGTKRRPKAGMISTQLDSLGAQFNAFTSQEYTGYWAKAGSEKLPQILDLVADMYLDPIFEPAEIEKERGVVIEELNMYEDTPKRRVQDLFMQLVYGDQPAGWDIGGEKDIIRKITREQIIQYRQARYVAPGTVVVIAGDFDGKKALGDIRTMFGNLPKKYAGAKPKTVEHQKTPAVLVKHKASDQSHIALGFRAFNVFDDRRYAMQILCDLLGGGMSSRLFHRVREELGAAYYINAGDDLFLDHGFMNISAGIDHQKFETVLKAIVGECDRLRRELVSSAELKKTKDHLTGSMMIGLETSDELASFYGGQEILTGTFVEPKTILERLGAVTADDVRRLARFMFSPKKANLAIIGPYKKSDPFKKLLSF